MKKIVLIVTLFFASVLMYSQTVNQPNQFNSVCDDNNDGFALFSMQEIGLEIANGNPNLVVTHHETQSDAVNNVNPLPTTYINIANPQLIFARVFNTVTSQVQIITYNLNVIQVPVVTPQTLTGCSNTQCWDLTSIIPNLNPGANCQFVFYTSQMDAMAQINAILNPTCFVSIVATPTLPPLYFTVNCNTASDCFSVGTLYLITTACYFGGQPQDLIACSDNGGFACIDLHLNDANVLGNLNPAENTVTYYNNQNDATTGTNPMSSPFCPPYGTYTLYSRVASNDGLNYFLSTFVVSSATYQNSTTQLSTIVQCDDNNNGLIIWDLTVVQAQLNTANSLSYYASLLDAQNMTSPIGNPAVWTTNVQPNLFPIFIREILVGGCDLIHVVQIQGLPNCNAASSCSSANSLCNSLGVAFNNTTGLPSIGSPGCLGSTPNPTWFYLPISGAGNLNFQINQGNNAPNFNNLDVDFICWGPFTLPQCTGLYDFPDGNTALPNNVVACSYSAAPVENFTIPNAQPGQYYMLLVTNFSNQLGQVSITQTNTAQVGSGEIDCTGLGLIAFLDANSNGTKDAGEQNFPLGQFHYEKNNDGTVHHITAPTGIYNLYDTNNTNTYDVSYSVETAYAAMYNVAPSSYSNVSVVLGSGLSNYYFPVTLVQPYNDLAITIVPLNAPRPGFTYQNKIIYTNFGSQNVPSGAVTFTNDTNVTITSNTQTGTTPTANGFTYNFTNLAPFEVRTMTVTMQVPTIPTINAGQFLTNTASIVPLTGDIVPENNTSTSSEMVINAYDPNDKMESHGDRILHSTFTSNDYLYYTIRFENTGNASAINVRINDVLDSQLDETTLRMISASHNYNLDRVGNVLNWTFDNIQLPVSVPNTNIGKGYITFKIKPNPGYAVGDVITNAASIYFDFNPAIVTNVFSTQFVANLGTSQFENSDFILYPNPTSDLVTVSLANTQNTIASIIVYDVLGKTILAEKVSDVTTQTIDVSSLNTGMYFIEVTTSASVKVLKKLMVN